jgi:hypothetical protein
MDIQSDRFIHNVEITCSNEKLASVEAWLEQNTLEHCMIKRSVLRMEQVYNVIFVSRDDALRFKLTWGGIL